MKAWSFIVALTLLVSPLVAGPLLILDAGHGGANPGVHVEGLTEAEIVLGIALDVQQQLKALGLEAALTRVDNSDLRLSQRVALANVSGARAFLSLHVNHSASPYAKGIRIFIAKAGNPTPKDEPLRWNSAAATRSEEARPLALALAKALNQSEKQKISVQNMNLAIFKGLSLPGVVIELGFLSHAETLQNFKEADYRHAVATRLAAGIKAWAGATGTVDPAPGAKATGAGAVSPTAGLAP